MSTFPRPRSADPELEPVIEAWRHSAELHGLNAPAERGELAAVEESLGRAFPSTLHTLYEMSNGGRYLEGNLMLNPLRGGGRYESVATLAETLRANGAALPSEIVVVGGDGSDALFGLWLPKGANHDAEAPVIELNISGESFALAGTDLARFLKGRTAYYLILCEAQARALDSLGVPEGFRVPAESANDALFYALRTWADPALPDPRADPYENPTGAEDLRRRYGRDG